MRDRGRPSVSRRSACVLGALVLGAWVSSACSDDTALESSESTSALRLRDLVDATAGDAQPAEGSAQDAQSDRKAAPDCKPAKFGPRGDASITAAIVSEPKNYWGTADLEGRDGKLIENEKLTAERAGAACIVGTHGDAGWIGFIPPQSFIDGCKGSIGLSVCLANKAGPDGMCSVAQTLASDWKVDPDRVVACDGCVEPRGKGTDKDGKPCGILHCAGGRWGTASGASAPEVPGLCFSSG